MEYGNYVSPYRLKKTYVYFKGETTQGVNNYRSEAIKP